MTKKVITIFDKENFSLLRRFVFSGFILGVLICFLFFWANSLEYYPNDLEGVIDFFYILAFPAGVVTLFLLVVDLALAAFLINVFDAQIEIPIDLDFAVFPQIFVDSLNAIAIVMSYMLLFFVVYVVYGLIIRK